MQNSQSSELIVTQLLEIDTKLATQEVELTLQLQSIQEKRHSLKNVISLFPPVDTATRTPVTTPTPVVEDVADIPEAATPVSDKAITNTTEAAPQSQKRQGKKNTSLGSKPSKQSSPAKEITKEAAIWAAVFAR